MITPEPRLLDARPGPPWMSPGSPKNNWKNGSLVYGEFWRRMICVDEMLATAGTVRAAIREKSGNVVAPVAAAAGALTVGAGAAGVCAAASSADRIFPVITIPAVSPQSSNTTAKTSGFIASRQVIWIRRAVASGSFGQVTVSIPLR